MEQRIELKYLIDIADYHHLSRQLDLFMNKDPHATQGRGYWLSSLYFDDMYDSATYDKADGVEYHRKFRIRRYEDGRQRLEYKVKNQNLSTKEFYPLDDVLKTALIDGNRAAIDPYLKHPLIRQIFLKMTLDHLEPRLYIDYFREVYIFGDNEVRVTFDSHMTVYNRFNPDQIYQVLEPNQIVMEVKYRRFLPDAVKKVVFQKPYQAIPYSKYLMGWLKMNNWGV